MVCHAGLAPQCLAKRSIADHGLAWPCLAGQAGHSPGKQASAQQCHAMPAMHPNGFLSNAGPRDAGLAQLAQATPRLSLQGTALPATQEEDRNA